MQNLAGSSELGIHLCCAAAEYHNLDVHRTHIPQSPFQSEQGITLERGGLCQDQYQAFLKMRQPDKTGHRITVALNSNCSTQQTEQTKDQIKNLHS